MAYIIFSVVYLIAGFILAIPYCLLAGWAPEYYLKVSLFAPAFSLIWFIWASLAGVIDFRRYSGFDDFNWRKAFTIQQNEEIDGSIFILWVWTLFIFLPVIFHWCAKVLGVIGYQTIASFLEAHRYASTFYAIFSTLILIFLTTLIRIIWLRVNRV